MFRSHRCGVPALWCVLGMVGTAATVYVFMAMTPQGKKFCGKMKKAGEDCVSACEDLCKDVKKSVSSGNKGQNGSDCSCGSSCDCSQNG
ncbi:MAG: hypothetical protein MJ078_07670 [Clostridia bacterium]|nr:hypothetical protein [Clostridia bacterium]